MILTRLGILGTITRHYLSERGTPMVLVSYGAHGYVTPVRARDCAALSSHRATAESEARELVARGFADEKTWRR